MFATDKLICLDCIRFREEIPRCPAHLTNCTGCLLVQERLGEEELHESLHNSDSGAHIGENLPCAEDAKDEEEKSAMAQEER